MTSKLKGLAAQGMAARKRSLTPICASYPQGSYTFTAPTPGTYRFVLWGGGASVANSNDYGGASGAFIQIERPLNAGQSVALVVGAQNADTTATLPSGEIATAGRGDASPNTGGVASLSNGQQLGDVLLNGSPGGVSDGAGQAGGGNAGGAGGSGSGSGSGGGGAPGWGRHRGGNGAAYNAYDAGAPGGGGSMNSASGGAGAPGLALIYQVRMGQD